MFSPGHMEMLLKKIMDQLGIDVPGENNSGNKNNKNQQKSKPSLTHSQVLVILGLLSGALSVDSVLVARDQSVQIVLTGTLKRKTKLDKMLDQVGPLPFDEVMNALVDRYE